MIRRLILTFAASFGLLGAWPALAPAQGIPQPGITLYGVVTDQSGAVRVTSGMLEFSYSPQGGGATVTVSTQLANLNGQFSYVITIPVEEAIGSFTVSANTLPLPDQAVTYTLSATLNGEALEIVSGGATSILSPDEHRGIVQRVDLRATGEISVPEDADENGVVNSRDLLVWFQYWMTTAPSKFDFDNTGTVDSSDLHHLMETIRQGKQSKAGASDSFRTDDAERSIKRSRDWR